MKQIFILAAGKQKRFDNIKTPKQLLVYDNESLLERQIRQLEMYDLIPTIVTKNKQIIQQFPNLCFQPKNNKSILHTIQSSSQLWNKNIVFLLGDVFYSNDLMNEIIKNEQSIRFFMTKSEIFSIKFSIHQKDFILRHIDFCINKLDDPKIWNLYRSLNELELTKHIIVQDQPIVSDYSFDVDYWQQYQDTLKNLLYLKSKQKNL